MSRVGTPTPAALVPIRALARVVESRDEGGANRRLLLEVPGWPGFAPGQFAMLSPGACQKTRRTDPLLPRPMAIYRSFESSTPGESAGIEVLYRITGRGTALLSEVRSGDRIQLLGPLGCGFPLPEDGRRAILVAGGTGIASVFELALRCAQKDVGSEVTVLFGARSSDDLMGFEDFAGLEGVDVQVATEDGSRGVKGLVTELLETALADRAPAQVYACGPTAMMRRAAEVARAHERPCMVSLENNMACGFGVCLGCAAPLAGGGFALVCREGPVFAADAVEWDGLL